MHPRRGTARYCLVGACTRHLNTAVRPYIKDATELATCDLNQLDRWSWEFPGCGWRVVMQGSGIWALDIDVPGADHVADGAKALADLVAVHGPLPPGPTTRSGGGGSAIFFSHTDEPIIGKTGLPSAGPRSTTWATNGDGASVDPSQDTPALQSASGAVGRFTAACPAVAVAAYRIASGGACSGRASKACRAITNVTALR